MDYKKKYEKLVDAVKVLRDNNPSDEGIQNWANDNVPELKESEDERIREEIIDYIKTGTYHKKWIAWLEKQGEKETDPRYENLEELLAADDIYQMAMNDDMVQEAKTKVINALSELEIGKLLGIEKQGQTFTKKDVDDAYLKGVTDTKNEIEKQYEANYQIRKDIATFIFNYKGDIKDRDKWMNYLGINVSFVEKQDEDKEINNFDVLPGLYKCVHRMFDGTPDGKLLFEIGNIYKCLSKHDIAEFEVSYGHSIYLQDPVVCKHFIPFEKQGEKPQGKSALEAIRDEKVDNANKVEPKDYSSIDPYFGKPIDKVEPKFHKGDWIVFNGLTLYVKEVVKGFYRTISKGGISNSYDWDIDKIARFWTIKDAKDGDVLATEDKNFTTPFVAIYKSIGDTVYDNITFNSHCFIGFDGNFYGGEEGHTIEDIHPATKEQRKLLSQRMKEAGYEWDGEKKRINEG